MRPKKMKLLAGILAVMLCMTAFSVTAFASGDDWCEYGDYGTPEASESAGATETPAPSPTPEVTPTPEPEVTPAPAEPAPSTTPETPPQEDTDPSGDGEIGSGKPLTPPGNLNLVDDVLQTDQKPDDAGDNASTGKKDDELEEKQFITVQSKNGNYFYIVIDRSGDSENVHFLNQVDEADLMALIEGDSAEEKPPVCTCTDKCMVGDINLSCPVCQTTMSECAGKEPVPEPTPEPDTEPEKEPAKAGSTAPLLIVLVLAMVGGGAVYYFKFRKPKIDTKGPALLDDYDFGEDEDEDYEYEKDDADEPEERGEDS